MARWRKVEVSTWEDERFVEMTSPQPNGQTLWLYLLCGPRTTSFPGLVVAREEVMASDLRWPVEAFREAFREASSKASAKADWKAGVVVLPKALIDSSGEPRETSKPASPNVLRSWAKSWDEIPECHLKYEYLQTLGSFAKGLGAPFAKAFAEAFRKALAKPSPQPSPNQEKEKEKEKKQEKEYPDVPADRGDPRPPRTPKVKLVPPPEALKAAERLMQCIIANHPGGTLAKAAASKQREAALRWADSLRLLHGADKHSWEEISAMVEWCQSDHFWKSNILSAEKLREKWDTLVAQRARNEGVRDVRYGRVEPHPPEAYDENEDPFGERGPATGALS